MKRELKGFVGYMDTKYDTIARPIPMKRELKGDAQNT